MKKLKKKRLLLPMSMAILGSYVVATGMGNPQTSTKIADIEKKWIDLKMKYPPSNKSKELRIFKEIPSNELEEQGIYLWAPNRIVMNSNKELLISDVKLRQIVKYSLDGKFIESISRKGQGAEELMNPFCIVGCSRSFFVSDTGNYSIKRFSDQGKYINGFKVFKTYIEIAYDENAKNIYAVPINTTPDGLTVDILDEGGKLLKSFGKPIIRGIRWQLSNWPKIALTNDGDLICAYVHFPVIQRYSRDGQIKEEWRIERKDFDEAEKHNTKYVSGDKEIAGIMPMICSLKIVGTRLFLLRSYPRMEILEYDLAGKNINEYWFDNPYGFSVADFAINEFVSKSETKIEFYIVQKSPESKILAMGPITQ